MLMPPRTGNEQVTHVVSLFDYYPASDEELPLKKGQRVAILATDESRKGWLYAQGMNLQYHFVSPAYASSRQWKARVAA